MSIAVLYFVQILFVVVFVICAAAPLYVIPREIYRPKWVLILAWAGYGALSVALPMLWWNDLLTMVFLTIYYLAVGRLCYYKSKMGWICQIISSAVMWGAQYIAIYVTMQVWMILQPELIVTSYLMAALKGCFMMLGAFLLCMVLRKRYADGRYLKIKGMILVPLCSMVLMFLYAIGSDVFLIRYGYQWIIIYCILIVIINLYCMYFWYDVAKNGELKHQLKLMEQQNELTLQYYRDMEENYNRSRKIIHDIRNHLYAIEESNKIDNNEYVQDMHEMLNSLGMKFYTENRMLNIVLNDKLKGLDSEQVDCKLGGLVLDFISDMDITTIFANLLDNAREAKIASEHFYLQIRGNKIQDFTIINMKNPAWNGYQEGVSTKQGHEGLGLVNVRQAVEKYGGEMKVEQKDGIFSVTIVFAR